MESLPCGQTYHRTRTIREYSNQPPHLKELVRVLIDYFLDFPVFTDSSCELKGKTMIRLHISAV